MPIPFTVTPRRLAAVVCFAAAAGLLVTVLSGATLIDASVPSRFLDKVRAMPFGFWTANTVMQVVEAVFAVVMAALSPFVAGVGLVYLGCKALEGERASAQRRPVDC